MKALTVAACAACLVSLTVTPALARKHKPAKPYRHYEAYRPYAYATERQRRNSLAFETGDYYERIQSEQVFGSRSWWMLQNRGGGRR